MTIQVDNITKSDLEKLPEKTQKKIEKEIFCKKLLRFNVSSVDIKFACKRKFKLGISPNTLTKWREEISQEEKSRSQLDIETIQELEKKIKKNKTVDNNQITVITQLVKLFLAFNKELRETKTISTKAFIQSVKSELTEMELINKYVEMIK